MTEGEIMDVVDMRQALGALLDELSPRLDGATARFAASDFEGGEEALSLNLLITTLTADRIPITPAQRDVIRSIIEFFDLDEEQRRVHPALADPQRVDILVDVPSPEACPAPTDRRHRPRSS